MYNVFRIYLIAVIKFIKSSTLLGEFFCILYSKGYFNLKLSPKIILLTINIKSSNINLLANASKLRGDK